MIVIDILQYILKNQSAETNYFNRYFVLEHRLANEKNYKKKEIRYCIISRPWKTPYTANDGDGSSRMIFLKLNAQPVKTALIISPVFPSK